MGKRKDYYNKLLKQYYGYDGLKKEQFIIMNRILYRKQDVCAVLATGFGKSVCYQLPHLITGKCVIVVSPLLSLMEDQCQELKRRKIPVCCLNSSNPNKRREWDALMSGQYKVVYAAPEYLVHCEMLIRKLNEEDGICCFAIDESHCISTWSDDSFRPEYKKLSCLREWAPTVPILALTATASKKVQKDIVKTLGLRKHKKVQSSFDRPNLIISVRNKHGIKNLHSDLWPIIRPHLKRHIIIYTRTIKLTHKIADQLCEWGVSAAAYNSKIADREEVQADFMSGRTSCIVATVAFGMGINNPHVRLVVHYGCPPTMEAYYQEIGRAGRDGEKSDCVMLYSNQDFHIAKFFAKQLKSKKFRTHQMNQINKMEKYAHSMECRRGLILDHFDEDFGSDKCDGCDNCLTTDEREDVTQQLYQLLETINLLPCTYGSTTVIGIIRGSRAKNIKPAMQKFSTYGSGKHKSANWWKNFVRKMVIDRLVDEETLSGRYGGSVIGMSVQGTDWLNSYKKHHKRGSSNKISRVLI